MSADLLQRLADAGTPMSLIMEVAETLAEARAAERLLEKRREKDRDRKRNSKDSVETAERAETPSPNEYISNPLPTPSVVSNETTPPTDLILVSEVEQPDQLKPEHVVEVWNDVAERRGLAKVKQLTPQRRRKLVSRIKEAGVDGFTEAIGTIEASPFLRGENGRGWRADFDWMLEPKNFTKLREGAYGH